MKSLFCILSLVLFSHFATAHEYSCVHEDIKPMLDGMHSSRDAKGPMADEGRGFKFLLQQIVAIAKIRNADEVDEKLQAGLTAAIKMQVLSGCIAELAPILTAGDKVMQHSSGKLKAGDNLAAWQSRFFMEMAKFGEALGGENQEGSIIANLAAIKNDPPENLRDLKRAILSKVLKPINNLKKAAHGSVKEVE